MHSESASDAEEAIAVAQGACRKETEHPSFLSTMGRAMSSTLNCKLKLTQSPVRWMGACASGVAKSLSLAVGCARVWPPKLPAL